MKQSSKIQTACLFLVSLSSIVTLGAGPGDKTTSGERTGGNQIHIEFEKTILPILRQSCFPCHMPGSLVLPPSVSPDVARKMRKESFKAQGDFEMNERFPFPNDNPAHKQLDFLEKEIKEKKMPPESRKKLGIGVSLSDTDRRILLKWVAQEKKTKK